MEDTYKKTPWYVKPSEPLVLRTSLLKTYLRCPAQCYFRYFKGLIVLPRSYATMGSCTHEVAEYSNLNKLKKGKVPKLSVLQDVFHEKFKWRKHQTSWLATEKPNKFEIEGTQKMVPVYREKLAQVVNPKYVEEQFQLSLPDLNVIVTGTLDLVEQNDLIRDLKTKSRTPNWMEAIKSFQGKSYRAGYESKFHKKPKGFILDYLVRKATPEVSSSKMVLTTELDTQEFLGTVKDVAIGIRKGCFSPRRESNYFCSPNSCGFWNICVKGAWRNPTPYTKVFGHNQEEKNEKGEE